MTAKLHIGSGTWYYNGAGWINVDADANNQVDIVASALHLPFPDGLFDQVYMGHFLEHIPFALIPTVIKELLRASTQNVRIAAVGPCMRLAREQASPQWLYDAIEALDPPDPHPGSHAWTATTELTYEALTMSGLDAQEVHISKVARPEWPNPNHYAEWQCAFLAWRKQESGGSNSK